MRKLVFTAAAAAMLTGCATVQGSIASAGQVMCRYHRFRPSWPRCLGRLPAPALISGPQSAKRKGG